MDIQKFRIKRTNPDIHWELPCSGGTNFWPINTSINCSGVTMYATTGMDIMESINGDILTTFPDELKHCSPIDPCVILWNTGPSLSPSHCTSIDGFLYVLFEGLKVTYLGTTYTDSFDQVKSVISIGQSSSNTLNVEPKTFGCQCLNPLGDELNKIPVLISQDFNDIGHYSIWDGNISQQEVFANFVFSGVSNGGYGILVSNTTDFGYYEQLQQSPYTIDWGDGTSNQYLYFPSLTTQAIKIYATAGKYNVVITQDSPWGPLTTMKVLSIPQESYPIMAGSVISPTDPTLQMDQASPLQGPTTYDIFGNPSGFQGASTGYFNQYNVDIPAPGGTMPMDAGTHINQYSGMTFGPGSLGGQPCFTVSGITTSILGNFQTYTSLNTADLPPGYNAGVTVPIGGDVEDPITGGLLTGVYGVINFASPIYTAYTISSAANSTGTADGDTPIQFWDFPNGITIFEATSCGLDNLAWGAEECIACPSGDCEYCTTKDEYVDRVTGVPTNIGPGVVTGDWSPSGNYIIGDIVYDVTYNSCCCFMAVTNISSGDPWFGKAPVTMLEGVFDDAGVFTHVWEACSFACVACPPGTLTPCDDFSVISYFYSPGNSYNNGDFIEGENGNCYMYLGPNGTIPVTAPTGYTIQYTTEWDYIGCVSWICPVEGPESDCDSDCITTPPINGVWNLGQMNLGTFGWFGGPYNSSFIQYIEFDTANYLGSCYMCIEANSGSYFPCSDSTTWGTPDMSPKWQQCPLPSSTSLDCIMISGATLDTFDQYGNPITITGFPIWSMCDAALTGGTCFESKWKCVDQYSCNHCIPILSDDPVYFTPLAFDTEQDCLDWCEPPAYSCATPYAQGSNCCAEISCVMDSTQYINTMIMVGALASNYINLAYTWGLYLNPPYTIMDCDNGVIDPTLRVWGGNPPVNIAPLGDIDECCVNTVWKWNCEFGCQSMGGTPTQPIVTVGTADPAVTFWVDQLDCENNMLTFYSATLIIGEIPCSWWCCDPYLPYNPPAPGPYQSPCVPCFSMTLCGSLCGGFPLPPPVGGGPFSSEAICVTACTIVESCWVCDCDLNPVCNNIDPCPTLLSTNPDTYGPDPGGGLNGIPSYDTEPDCLTACTCSFGWDCFYETGTTLNPTIPPILKGCQDGVSLANIAVLNWQVSDPTPGFTGYTDHTECCYANIGCCHVHCDDGNLPAPTPLGDWPCEYTLMSGPPAPCCDPLAGCTPPSGLPWCFMVDCTNALCPPLAPATLPTCCDPVDDSCDCACEPPVNSTGLWDSGYFLYDTDDAVYWGDTDTDFCCFKCYCDLILPPGPPTPGVASTYDCNHFTPGDPPTPEGIQNCWVNCNKTPGPPPVTYLGATYNPCSACTAAVASYECTVDGCIPGMCDPLLGTGYLFNCYTTSNCDDECRGQCICTDQFPPFSCQTNCITYQMELWGGTSPFPTDCPPSAVSAAAYPYISYNACMGINPVNALLPDCCPTLPPQWYCDNSSNCNSNIPQTPGVDGVGCVGPINSGHALYQNPITTNFTSLLNCENNCKWCCDPNGITTCMFVGPVSYCPGTLYINAIQCYLATTTNTPCDCAVPPTEWWCHYDQPNDLGGCVSNTLGLSDLDLFGTSGLDRATDPALYFTSLINCEAACKFCCDCDVTGECYLNWYCNAPNPGGTTGCDCHDCYDNLPQCAVDQEPCVVVYPEIYCDDILGCRIYPVINTLMSGPYTGPAAMTTCQLVCQFECNQDCGCEFTATPAPWTTPCYDLACCNVVTNNGLNCCKCEECITNSPHSYSYEVAGVLQTYFIVITTLPSFPLPWDPTAASSPTTYYDYGDIVVGIDGCCYIMVLSSSADWLLYDTTLQPNLYYNQYVNALNTTGLPIYGTDLMWIPCDPDCPLIHWEENWWCDANPTYNWVPNNCVEEHPWITSNNAGDPLYGNLVFGHDGAMAQVAYNSGGLPFDSKAQCEENCRFCCEEEPGPDDCCCCDDDGTGNCLFGTQVIYMNPMNLPCYIFCPQQSSDPVISPVIECPEGPKPECCCCEDDGQAGCVNGTLLWYSNPMNIPCSVFCPNQDGFGIIVECPSVEEPCCCCVYNTYLGGCVPGTPYNPSNPSNLPCNQLCANLGEIECIGELGPSGPEGLPKGKRETPEEIRRRIPGISSAVRSSSPPISAPPCCIICETASLTNYVVYAPCLGIACNGTDTQIGPCVSPITNPCFLDWACQTCAQIDCYPSFYSCATLTNNCLPEDCADCLHYSAYYQTNQLLGYWNPQGNYFNPSASYDGWNGTTTIPYSSPQTWVPNAQWWNWGQIVIDPNDKEGCCWIRVKRHDTNVHPYELSDAWSPREHYCNYLSGNSADGANMFNPLGGTVYTMDQGIHPWWLPCDDKCPSCKPGGNPTLSWKCVDGNLGSCIQGPWAWTDQHTFPNQIDCDNLCKSWLCNNNPYWNAQAKCANTNHNSVVGTDIDNIEWFINHANDLLPAVGYVFTDNTFFNPLQLVPCPVPTGPFSVGHLYSVQNHLIEPYCSSPCIPFAPNSCGPNPNGGSCICANWVMTIPNIASPDWNGTKAAALLNYHTDISGVSDFTTLRSIMTNHGCEWVKPGSPQAIDCAAACPTCASIGSLGTSNMYNHSGLYTDPNTNECSIYDSTTPEGNCGCCFNYKSVVRPCYCQTGHIGCDCWLIAGTGTTGGPGNIWDYTFSLDDYTGCTTDCCIGTCECCEPNLKLAGFIGPTVQLMQVTIGGAAWSAVPLLMSLQINECLTLPDGYSAGQDFSGLWNYGSGTLSGGCCFCCVAGGTGTNSDPLNDGNPNNSSCFFEAHTDDGLPTGNWNQLILYEYDGQWVSCGVMEDCSECGTPVVAL